MRSQAAPQSLRIEKLVYGGAGLARADGKVVLTPFVLPGELVQADLRRAKNDLLRGTPQAILEASPRRVPPPCPYFARCGGCHYQHADYETQLEQKKLILLEVLQRVGRIQVDEPPILLASPPWEYRNRAQLHIQNGQVGYFAAESHTLIPIRHCPISSPRLNQAIAQLAHDLPRHRGFSSTVEVFTDESRVQVNPLDRVPPSVRPILDSLGSAEPLVYRDFRVSRGSFFQVNRFLLDSLVQTALGSHAGRFAVDLYAGVGLFARSMLGRFERVVAVEPGASAFRDLLHNLQENAAAQNQTADQYLAALSQTPDWILADPPRAGLGRIVTRELLRLRPPALTLVSCDPATLARDLRVLLDGGYRIQSITLADLFPQTYHLESIVQLSAP